MDIPASFRIVRPNGNSDLAAPVCGFPIASMTVEQG
jgi:hypothetical protein